MNNLLPCPLCGGSDCRTYKFTPDAIFKCWGVWCACSAKVTGFETEQEAIVAWNRRSQTDNEPLTLDEMNALDHEPIYVLHTGGKWTMNGWHIATASSYQNHGRCDLEIDNGNTIIDMQNYGKTWLAYRSKPKEAP